MEEPAILKPQKLWTGKQVCGGGSASRRSPPLALNGAKQLAVAPNVPFALSILAR